MKDLEEVVLLADFDDNSQKFVSDVYNNIKELESERGDLGFGLRNVEVERFPDGEFEPRIKGNVRGRRVVYIHDSSLNPSEWWTKLMLVNNAAKLGKATYIVDVLPYMRWSRSEKKDKPHISIATKVMASTISINPEYRADNIISLDIHAPAIQGQFGAPTDCLQSFQHATEEIKKRYPNIDENLVVVAPDAGSTGRARAFANRLGDGIDIAIIDKKRKDGNNVKAYNIVGEVEGKNCFIVDDLVSSGGTQDEARRSVNYHYLTLTS